MYEESSRLITHFSEKLRVNEVVPYLRLPSSRDGCINLWDLKQKRNLVIFFHHGIAFHRVRMSRMLASLIYSLRRLCFRLEQAFLIGRP